MDDGDIEMDNEDADTNFSDLDKEVEDIHMDMNQSDDSDNENCQQDKEKANRPISLNYRHRSFAIKDILNYDDILDDATDSESEVDDETSGDEEEIYGKYLLTECKSSKNESVHL